MLNLAVHAASRAIIWRDLGGLYAARSQQKPADLPDLSLGEADYSAWEHTQVQAAWLLRF